MAMFDQKIENEKETITAFLKIDGIPGESTAAGFENQIEILAFEIDVQQARSATQSSVGGHGSSSGKTDGFKALLPGDMSGPRLFETAFAGRTTPKAVVTLCRQQDGKLFKYREYLMTNVVISELVERNSMSGQSEAELRLSFGRIETTYTQQKHDGSVGGKTSGKFNLEQNRVG